MLKLIKNELLHSYRSFAMVFGVFLIACVIFPLLPLEVTLIGTIFTTLAMVGISVAVTVTILRNYHSSMFKKPGYLTLTLPVSTHEIVLSKIIAAIIWIIVSSIILFLGIFILFLIGGMKYNAFADISIMEFINTLIGTLDNFDFVNLASAQIYLLAQLITSVTGGFVLITLVQTKYTRNYKALIGALIFIAFVFISTITTDMISQIPSVALFVTSYSNQFALLWLGILGNLVLSVIFYAITIYVINNMIEIE
jgi:hypothetical protein